MADMRDRLAELIADSFGVDPAYFDVDQFALADHLLANGVILPPCKVGDTVYSLDDYVSDSSGCRLCEHFFAEGFGDLPECGKTKDGRKAAECTEIKEETVTYRDILRHLSFDHFGKTVFLTREEAEKALREKEK